MSISVSLTGTLKATDTVTGTLALSKVLTNLVFAGGTTFSEASALSVAAGGTVITLPINPTQFIYVKNTHASVAFDVFWTLPSLAEIKSITLQPGGAIIVVEPNSVSGIVTLKFVGNSATSQAEYVLAG